MATQTSHLLRPLVASVALVAAMAALLIAYGASPTHAAGSCSTTSGTTTCTFSPTGKEDTFVVPAGVSSIHVVATGAPGAVGDNGSTAGRGAQVSTDLSVGSGQTLYVNVGGTPTGVGTRNCTSFTILAHNCIGGFNGGGTSLYGGGGGGASDVRLASRAQQTTLYSRLIVAAGGGGSGALNPVCFNDDGPPTTPLGGAGGDAGSDGGPSESCEETNRPPGALGGHAGTQTAGGTGGPSLLAPSGVSGTLGQGGGNAFAVPSGGGGGSNLWFGSGTATISNSASSVTISYQEEEEEPPPQRCTVTGTRGSDTLQGTARDDVICGLGGAGRPARRRRG